MTDYKATPEQWEHVHICAGMEHQIPWATADCLLELRAKVEVLEDAAHKHIVETSANILALASRVDALEAAKRPASKTYKINEPLKLTPEQQEEIAALLRPNSKPAVKGPLLVTRVAAVISQDGEPINWTGAYAAIREVASWMKDQGCYPDAWMAQRLEKEAER